RYARSDMQDLKFALRQLRKSPGFTLIAVITIALGIGATTAIFTVVDATLLKPLPYPQAEQLVTIQDDLPGLGARDVGMSRPEWEDLRRSGVFEYVSPTWFDENNLTGSEQPARVRLLIVAPNYFELLRVKPQLGRGFNPRDHSPGFVGEIVISDSLWKRAFSADPHILDRSVRMDTDLYRIVGVMPPAFDDPGRRADERNIQISAATSLDGARLMQQLLTESLLLSLLGGVAGLAVLFAVKDLLLRFVPDDLARLNEISISWTVLLFALCASVFSGVIFGLAPAFQASRLDLQQALKQEGQGSVGSAQRARTRRGLVITEFALSLVLMIAAALLLHSFWDLVNLRTGFNTRNMVTVRTRMPYPNDPSVDKYATASQEAPFVRELIRRCATLAGVEEVAVGDPATIPLDQTGHELNVLEGHF